MVKNILTILFLAFVSQGFSQNKIYDVVEMQPEFPGGQEKMYEFLSAELIYPEKCRENDIQGKVYIQFVITKRGKISQIKILKTSHELFAEEAKRVIKKMPKWKPGKQRGKKVNVRYTLPINFSLD